MKKLSNLLLFTIIVTTVFSQEKVTEINCPDGLFPKIDFAGNTIYYSTMEKKAINIYRVSNNHKSEFISSFDVPKHQWYEHNKFWVSYDGKYYLLRAYDKKQNVFIVYLCNKNEVIKEFRDPNLWNTSFDFLSSKNHFFMFELVNEDNFTITEYSISEQNDVIKANEFSILPLDTYLVDAKITNNSELLITYGVEGYEFIQYDIGESDSLSNVEGNEAGNYFDLLTSGEAGEIRHPINAFQVLDLEGNVLSENFVNLSRNYGNYAINSTGNLLVSRDHLINQQYDEKTQDTVQLTAWNILFGDMVYQNQKIYSLPKDYRSSLSLELFFNPNDEYLMITGYNSFTINPIGDDKEMVDAINNNTNISFIVSDLSRNLKPNSNTPGNYLKTDRYSVNVPFSERNNLNGEWYANVRIYKYKDDEDICVGDTSIIINISSSDDGITMNDLTSIGLHNYVFDGKEQYFASDEIVDTINDRTYKGVYSLKLLRNKHYEYAINCILEVMVKGVSTKLRTKIFIELKKNNEMPTKANK